MNAYTVTWDNEQKRPGVIGVTPAMVETCMRGHDVAKSTCSLGDGRPVYGHGYCEAHAKRLRDRGDVMAHIPLGRSRRPTESLDDRVWARIDASGDCWEWTGVINRYGYGVVHLPRGGKDAVRTMAHRYVWEKLVGPIAPGLQIDHRCMNKRCVNPDHLDPVTHQENALRYRRSERGRAERAAA